MTSRFDSFIKSSVDNVQETNNGDNKSNNTNRI